MINVYRADQLKRCGAPFSLWNHSFTFSLNVKVCIRFTVFLQISLCFFYLSRVVLDERFVYWLHIFMFFVSSWRGGKKFEEWGKGIKKIRIGGGGVGGLLLLGGGISTPLHATIFHQNLYGHRFIVINGHKPLKSVFKSVLIFRNFFYATKSIAKVLLWNSIFTWQRYASIRHP